MWHLVRMAFIRSCKNDFSMSLIPIAHMEHNRLIDVIAITSTNRPIHIGIQRCIT